MKQLIDRIQKNKHRLATFALIIGFAVDIVTFRNLNLAYAQIILAVHLFIVATAILILATPVREKTNSFFAHVRSWTPVAHQYSTGNLLSAFLVLYSASGSFAQSWLFFALLAVAILGNERLTLQKYRLPFHTSLFFLNVLLFMALALPVVTRSISAASFLGAVVVATIIFQIFRRVLRFVAKEAYAHNRKRIHQSGVVVLVALVVLYFTNLIPPIPLTLKHINFYHSVERSGDAYLVRDETRGIFESFFDSGGKTLRLVLGEDAYVFTAVSAPAQLNTNVVHRWEYFDEANERWVTKNTVQFSITGGRHDGYRGFSLTEDPAVGKWRVSVETARGQVIGRAKVIVERANTQAILSSVKVF